MSLLPPVVTTPFTEGEAEHLFNVLLDSEGHDEDVGTFLLALTDRGESASEIIGEMSEMSAGAIGNNIMKAHARSYTAEEIRLIAEYLATR